jgi:hypothetical protein
MGGVTIGGFAEDRLRNILVCNFTMLTEGLVDYERASVYVALPLPRLWKAGDKDYAEMCGFRKDPGGGAVLARTIRLT